MLPILLLIAAPLIAVCCYIAMRAPVRRMRALDRCVADAESGSDSEFAALLEFDEPEATLELIKLVRRYHADPTVETIPRLPPWRRWDIDWKPRPGARIVFIPLLDSIRLYAQSEFASDPRPQEALTFWLQGTTSTTDRLEPSWLLEELRAPLLPSAPPDFSRVAWVPLHTKRVEPGGCVMPVSGSTLADALAILQPSCNLKLEATAAVAGKIVNLNSTDRPWRLVLRLALQTQADVTVRNGYVTLGARQRFEDREIRVVPPAVLKFSFSHHPFVETKRDLARALALANGLECFSVGSEFLLAPKEGTDH